jgi:hypothetical protein
MKFEAKYVKTDALTLRCFYRIDSYFKGTKINQKLPSLWRFGLSLAWKVDKENVTFLFQFVPNFEEIVKLCGYWYEISIVYTGCFSKAAKLSSVTSAKLLSQVVLLQPQAFKF